MPQVSRIRPRERAACATAAVSAASGLCETGVDELESHHGALAPNLADAGVLRLPLLHQADAGLTDRAGPFKEIVLLDHVQGRQGGGAGQGLPQ